MSQAQVAWVALLPERNSFFKLFEMVARIIMWLYKTSNMDKVRTSFKFFLNELPPIEAWQFYAIRGCPVSREEISWPWSFSTKPLQFVGLLTAKPSRKSCTRCSFEESSFSPVFLLVLNAIQSKVKFHELVALISCATYPKVPVSSKRTMYNLNLSKRI